MSAILCRAAATKNALDSDLWALTVLGQRITLAAQRGMHRGISAEQFEIPLVGGSPLFGRGWNLARPGLPLGETEEGDLRLRAKADGLLKRSTG